ncbi:PH domain-containing protein [Microlunatus sp. Gsoil 973]|jgi:membrane protein YdbS with pleckstrin-like domain|uniref:PH domain-containing protein n=1 Tax=Microlunatus sp. Gsoil 973 TaxID=2672569 RepID=UPI0012B4FDC6|nr:PH domain-containing protein [Microlunatus sp. Gsoil 973]QGN35725.1 PH domain-containing protein [Microlunatus sp. Gsoil 973]
MEELFATPGAPWQRLSPNYRSMRRLTSVIGIGVVFLAGALIAGLAAGLWWLAGVIIVVGAAILVARWIVVGRNWASWGYLEREEDLYITNGVLFRTMVTVPYGRMQLVEVRSTPLQRAYGLATVQLVTASASTDAAIPGLLPEEAARLRDRLSELGEARASGL